MAVLRISSHNSTSQINANRYSSRLKKIIDQKKLNYDAIPIRIYSIVQTTGNSQPGGAKSGLLIESKISILFCVRNADKLPTRFWNCINLITQYGLRTTN